jgi:hypothetical protein
MSNTLTATRQEQIDRYVALESFSKVLREIAGPFAATFTLGLNPSDLAVGYHEVENDVGLFSELWPEDEDLDTPEFRTADAHSDVLAMSVLSS